MKTTRLMLHILISIMLLLVACSGDQPLSPPGPDDTTTGPLFKKGSGKEGLVPPDIVSDLLLVLKREEAENGVSRAVIGPEGGVLVHAMHEVRVPAGALSEPVELTFSMPVSDTLMFELGPDGIQFNGPVTLVFNYDHAFTTGLDPELFTIVVWNTNSESWNQIATTVNTETNEVSGNARHFSRYAISKR